MMETRVDFGESIQEAVDLVLGTILTASAVAMPTTIWIKTGSQRTNGGK